MNRLSRRELLRWAAVAAGSSTLAVLPSGIALADTSPNSPLGQLLGSQADTADKDKTKEKDDQRQLVPISFSKTLLRADDLLALKFDFVNLIRSGNQLVLQDPTINGYVIVRFPPQAIGERAFYEGNDEEPTGPGYVRSRMADESRLAFVVPASAAPIPYTVDGLLDWVRWGQSVSPAAKPPEYVKDASAPQAIVEPAFEQTAINAPYRLTLSPHADAGWAHAKQPVTRGDRTELWHTRLGERKTVDGTPRVDEADPTRRTVRAIWSPDYNKNDPPNMTEVGDFRTSLSPKDRHDIVRLTSDYTAAPILQPNYTPKPIQVNNLMLSTLGAWIDTVGDWKRISGTDLDHWRHRSTMGRDHYVRVVYPGYLMPFGHPAVLIKISERKFMPATGQPGQQAAYLRQREFLVVMRPILDFTHHYLPFRKVQITNLVSPNLQDWRIVEHRLISTIEGAFWPRVAGADHLFHLVGTDSDGQRTEFSMPLPFVFAGTVDNDAKRQQLAGAYNWSLPSRRSPAMRGQRVAYAPSSPAVGQLPAKPGDTSLETVEMFFQAEHLPTQGGLFGPTIPFRARMGEAKVRLSGVDQASGKSNGNADPVRIELHPKYLEHGMPQPGDTSHPNKGYMFAKVGPSNGSGVPLQFAGDRSGGVITPNLQIKGLSRALGPTGSGNSDSISAGQFKPADFFNGAAPKILGGIPLTAIIGEFTDSFVDPQNPDNSKALPKLVTVPVYEGNDPTRSVRYIDTSLTWEPRVRSSTGQYLNFFKTEPGASLRIVARRLTKLAGPMPQGPLFSISGELNNFTIQLIPTVTTFLALTFNSLKFVSEEGQTPDIDVSLANVRFAGPLEFVNKLRHFLPLDTGGGSNGLAALGSNDSTGPGIDVRPDGITLSYGIGLPAIGLGVFALKNISLGTELNLPFTDDPMRLRFKFCDRADPGLVSVSMFSGTFFFGLALGLDGVEGFEAQIEFGGDLSIDLGVASGGVHVLAGVYYGMDEEESELTAHIRMGGELDILGLISVSLEFYLAMSYFGAPRDELWGQATLTVEVEVAMFSESVEVTVERRLAGSGDDSASLQAAQGLHGRAAPLAVGAPGAPLSPTFADLVPTQTDWADYCAAFA